MKQQSQLQKIINLLFKGAMMNLVRTLASVLAGFIFIATSLFSLQAMAVTPNSHMIPFQARLHDENGAVLADGVYQIQTKIYNAETGGENPWSETHSHVSVINGYVNLLLGGITPIMGTSVEFSARAYYLGIVIGRYHADGENVDISAELFPRHQLVPSFHAVTASDSARLGGVDADQFAKNDDVDIKVAVVAGDLTDFKNNNFKQETVSFPNGTSETLLSAKNADFLDGKTSADFVSSDMFGERIEGVGDSQITTVFLQNSIEVDGASIKNGTITEEAISLSDGSIDLSTLDLTGSALTVDTLKFPLRFSRNDENGKFRLQPSGSDLDKQFAIRGGTSRVTTYRNDGSIHKNESWVIVNVQLTPLNTASSLYVSSVGSENITIKTSGSIPEEGIDFYWTIVYYHDKSLISDD